MIELLDSDSAGPGSPQVFRHALIFQRLGKGYDKRIRGNDEEKLVNCEL